MSGIPTPRSGLARPTKLVAPGTLSRATTSISAAATKRPRSGDSEEDGTQNANKKAKPAATGKVMGPPSSRITTAARLAAATPSFTSNRRPLSARTNLNRTVASAQPSSEAKKGELFKLPHAGYWTFNPGLFSAKHGYLTFWNFKFYC